MGDVRALWWTLRIGAALCFIGHGAFGIITKEAWVPFFGVVGLGRDAAFALMPVTGAVGASSGSIPRSRSTSSPFGKSATGSAASVRIP
jgi:hypothetical protein